MMQVSMTPGEHASWAWRFDVWAPTEVAATQRRDRRRHGQDRAHRAAHRLPVRASGMGVDAAVGAARSARWDAVPVDLDFTIELVNAGAERRTFELEAV